MKKYISITILVLILLISSVSVFLFYKNNEEKKDVLHLGLNAEIVEMLF